MTTAKVKIEETFELTVNGVCLEGFVKESIWEGLHKLRNEEGQFVIVDFDPSLHAQIQILRMSRELRDRLPLDHQLGDKPFTPTHTHLKTGKPYQLYTVTNEAATKKNWHKQAVYTDGVDVWSRPLEQFLIGYKEIKA